MLYPSEVGTFASWNRTHKVSFRKQNLQKENSRLGALESFSCQIVQPHVKVAWLADSVFFVFPSGNLLSLCRPTHVRSWGMWVSKKEELVYLKWPLRMLAYGALCTLLVISSILSDFCKLLHCKGFWRLSLANSLGSGVAGNSWFLVFPSGNLLSLCRPTHVRSWGMWVSKKEELVYLKWPLRMLVSGALCTLLVISSFLSNSCKLTYCKGLTHRKQELQ